jgi:hypothetical protein
VSSRVSQHFFDDFDVRRLQNETLIRHQRQASYLSSKAPFEAYANFFYQRDSGQLERAAVACQQCNNIMSFLADL